MKFGNEFWLILFWEYISPNLFAVLHGNVTVLTPKGNRYTKDAEKWKRLCRQLSWWCPFGAGKEHLPTRQFIKMDRLIPVSTHPCARNYRPCFRENQPKRSFSIKWKRAFWACFRENWVYKFGHCFHFRQYTIQSSEAPSIKKISEYLSIIQLLSNCESYIQSKYVNHFIPHKPI